MEVATLPTLWHIYVSPVSLDPSVQCWLILLVVIEGEVRKGGTQWEMHLGSSKSLLCPVWDYDTQWQCSAPHSSLQLVGGTQLQEAAAQISLCKVQHSLIGSCLHNALGITAGICLVRVRDRKHAHELAQKWNEPRILQYILTTVAWDKSNQFHPKHHVQVLLKPRGK